MEPPTFLVKEVLAEKRISEVDAFGGKWKIVGRVFNPFQKEEIDSFRAALPKPKEEH